jgi:hypothetical protein
MQSPVLSVGPSALNFFKLYKSPFSIRLSSSFIAERLLLYVDKSKRISFEIWLYINEVKRVYLFNHCF